MAGVNLIVPFAVAMPRATLTEGACARRVCCIIHTRVHKKRTRIQYKSGRVFVCVCVFGIDVAVQYARITMF